MSTIRVRKNKDNPYVMLNKKLLQDPMLSAKAKGLLAYMLSLPDDWQIYVNELVKHFKDGRDSIRSGIDELINAGYITRERLRDEKGRYNAFEYCVYEVPAQVGFSHLGESQVGFPHLGEPVATNKDSTNKDLTNNNGTEREAVAPDPVDKFYGSIQEDITEVSFNTWIKPLIISLNGSTLTVEAPNEFSRQIVHERYMELLEAHLKPYFTYKAIELI